MLSMFLNIITERYQCFGMLAMFLNVINIPECYPGLPRVRKKSGKSEFVFQVRKKSGKSNIGQENQRKSPKVKKKSGKTPNFPLKFNGICSLSTFIHKQFCSLTALGIISISNLLVILIRSEMTFLTKNWG